MLSELQKCQCIFGKHRESMSHFEVHFFKSTFNQPQKVKVNNYITVQKFGFSKIFLEEN